MKLELGKGFLQRPNLLIGLFGTIVAFSGTAVALGGTIDNISLQRNILEASAEIVGGALILVQGLNVIINSTEDKYLPRNEMVTFFQNHCDRILDKTFKYVLIAVSVSCLTRIIPEILHMHVNKAFEALTLSILSGSIALINKETLNRYKIILIDAIKLEFSKKKI